MYIGIRSIEALNMPAAQKKILIAEDEKPIAKAFELKLNKAGFHTTVVSDGATALDTIGKGAFDLLLIDVIMPKMDGFQLLNELQKKGNAVQVVVTTNLAQQEDIAKAKGLGASAYFVKSDTPLANIVQHIETTLA